MNTQKIVIIVEGGIVQDVFSDACDWYTVIDHDSEQVGEKIHAGSCKTQPVSKLDEEIKKLLR